MRVGQRSLLQAVVPIQVWAGFSPVSREMVPVLPHLPEQCCHITAQQGLHKFSPSVSLHVTVVGGSNRFSSIFPCARSPCPTACRRYGGGKSKHGGNGAVLHKCASRRFVGQAQGCLCGKHIAIAFPAKATSEGKQAGRPILSSDKRHERFIVPTMLSSHEEA